VKQQQPAISLPAAMLEPHQHLLHGCGDTLYRTRQGEEFLDLAEAFLNSACDFFSRHPALYLPFDLGVALQPAGGEFEHSFIETPRHTLVGPENQGHGIPDGAGTPGRGMIPQHGMQPQFHRVIITVESAHRILVLTDADGRQGFHGPHHHVQIGGTFDFTLQLLQCRHSIPFPLRLR
jgi:hypothetical protein